MVRGSFAPLDLVSFARRDWAAVAEAKEQHWLRKKRTKRIISAEDLIVTKILAGRPKDLDDVEIIATAGVPPPRR